MHRPHPPSAARRRASVVGAGMATLGLLTLATGCGGGPAPAKQTNRMAAPRHPASAAPSPRPSRSSPRPRHTRRSAPTTHTPAHARSVTMIGDSITVRSENALWNVMPHAKINGEVGRQLTTAPGLVAQARRSGDLGQVLVIALGTNGNGGAAELDQAIDAAGPHQKVVLVTIDAARPWEGPVNADIRAVAAAHPDVTLADWHHTISGKEYLLVDGVHPNSQGSVLFARTVADAVNRAVAG